MPVDMTALDNEKLHEFIGKMLGDLGGAFSVPLVRIGEKLGLYDALFEAGTASVAELARTTGTTERYIREWACAQAASGYLDYDAAADTFTMTPEQAMVFGIADSPVNLSGAFEAAAAAIAGGDKVGEAFKTGEGVGWGDMPPACFARLPNFSDQGTLTILFRSGCRHWTVWWKNCGAAPKSPMSGVVTEFRPSSWPKRFPIQASLDLTFTRIQYITPNRTPRKLALAT